MQRLELKITYGKSSTDATTDTIIWRQATDNDVVVDLVEVPASPSIGYPGNTSSYDSSEMVVIENTGSSDVFVQNFSLSLVAQFSVKASSFIIVEKIGFRFLGDGGTSTIKMYGPVA